MKKMNLSLSVKNIFLGIFATTFVFAASSCAKKSSAISKTDVKTESAIQNEKAVETVMTPDNKGQVQIKRDVNSNYVIQINLKDLEELSTIKPGEKYAYIVWMDADKQLTKSLGQISSNTAWLSDKSKASFEATSVFQPTKIYISEETDPSVAKPGSKIIWSTSKF